MTDGQSYGGSFTFYIQRLGIALDNLRRVAAVVEIQPGAHLAHRQGISDSVYIRALAAHIIQSQTVAHAGQTADVIEYSLAETARSLVAVVVHV